MPEKLPQHIKNAKVVPKARKQTNKVAADAAKLKKDQKNPKKAQKDAQKGLKDVKILLSKLQKPKYKKIAKQVVTVGNQLKKQGKGKIDLQKMYMYLNMADKEVVAANKRPGPN